eukprot:3664465-Rhodomonas_salina.1
MPDNLTVEQCMMVDHSRHGHCGRTTRMRILKRHGSEGLPRGFVTLLNKFSCRFCQLTLGARQYWKSQRMKQKRDAKRRTKSKLSRTDDAETESDSETEPETVQAQNPVQITDVEQSSDDVGEEIFIDFGHSIAQGIHNE